jgi:two-component system OmpR family sensor kinase
MDRLRSLSARLVLTAVLLVAAVAVLAGTATTIAVRDELLSQLDQKVHSSIQRVHPRQDPDQDQDGDVPPAAVIGNQGPGTLVAYLLPHPTGGVLGDQPGDQTALSVATLSQLADVPTDGKVHAADVSGFGNYRVTAINAIVNGVPGVVVIGLPTADVDNLVDSLVLTELVLSLLAVLAAGGIGTFLVRRQLRPLREVAATAHAVAELPLASGAITLDERVPEHLTDARTEVGQVGAALNTLLDHVGSSLEARHRSEQQVRQFVADASHELRTPLTTIAGYTQLARRRPDDRGAADMALAKVEEESGRMTALVEDLLLLARLDSGRPLERTTVDLTRLLVEAVSDQRVLAPDHYWRLSLPEDSVEVSGDEQRLHQVVTNLLTNARKYTPAGTTVTVSAYSSGPGGGAGFAVHDDGPGFPPDLVDHAFERFARADAARTRTNGDQPGGGYGLGLSLVHAIVTAHGGTVDLRSTPGDTTVSVHLP